MASREPAVKTKNLFVLAPPQGPWDSFLGSYFQDAPVQYISCGDKNAALAAFDKALPAMVFAEPGLLSPAFIQKIKVRGQTDPRFRAFQIGGDPLLKKDPLFHASLGAEPNQTAFEKKWLEELPMPEAVKLLVVDDEEEITGMICDYFGGRTSPSFGIACARNGKEGLEAVKRERPDLIILDIKMPGMDGREFYAELRRRKVEIPVIIFFDSISGEELEDIRRYGNPPVVEKGTPTSSLPSLMALVKKMVYFGKQ